MYFEGHEMAEWLRLEFEVDVFLPVRSFDWRSGAQEFSQ
jgi:hypothetical protein